MKRVTLILAILVMVAPFAMGKTLYVDGSLTAGPLPSGYFSTIIDAHAAAAENDTIDIFAGTYQMNSLDLDYKHGITYKAHQTAETQYEKVVVQNWGNGNSIYCRGTDNLTFDGLIFVGKGQDSATNDYGVYMRSPYVDRTTFTRCIFTAFGKYGLYGYYGPGENTVIDQCSFINNKVGLYFNKSWSMLNDRITNCLFYDNQVWKPTEWDGVWIYAHWDGYAARGASSYNGSDGMILDYCALYGSYTTVTDSVGNQLDRYSLSSDAQIGVGCVEDVAPTFLSLDWTDDSFGYLALSCDSLIGEGGDLGQSIGARPIPEPATISLLMLGLLGLRRRRK